jgi:hypothetical protein
MIAETKPKTQDHDVHLRDDSGPEIGSPYSPFFSKESAIEFAKHWVYRHGETASATVYLSDDPEMEPVAEIAFEDVVGDYCEVPNCGRKAAYAGFCWGHAE